MGDAKVRSLIACGLGVTVGVYGIVRTPGNAYVWIYVVAMAVGALFSLRDLRRGT
jgi:hypothetical protein